MQASGSRCHVIRGGEIRLLLIDCCAPDSTDRRSLSETVLPHHLALSVGIEAVADSGFLRDHNDVAAVRHRGQYRRGSEIEVGSDIFGATGVRRLSGTIVAPQYPHIFRRDLAGPLHLSGLQIVCDDSVAGLLLRIAVTIARCDVDDTALRINCGSAPDSSAGGSP